MSGALCKHGPGSHHKRLSAEKASGQWFRPSEACAATCGSQKRHCGSNSICEGSYTGRQEKLRVERLALSTYAKAGVETRGMAAPESSLHPDFGPHAFRAQSFVGEKGPTADPLSGLDLSLEEVVCRLSFMTWRWVLQCTNTTADTEVCQMSQLINF